jgi:hypothetical protein
MMIVNYELEPMWKENVLGYYKTLLHNLAGEAEENRETSRS